MEDLWRVGPIQRQLKYSRKQKLAQSKLQSVGEKARQLFRLMEMASASFEILYLIMNKCDLSIFGSFFPSHYDVTETRDLKTNEKKGQFKFWEHCRA